MSVSSTAYLAAIYPAGTDQLTQQALTASVGSGCPVIYLLHVALRDSTPSDCVTEQCLGYMYVCVCFFPCLPGVQRSRI